MRVVLASSTILFALAITEQCEAQDVRTFIDPQLAVTLPVFDSEEDRRLVIEQARAAGIAAAPSGELPSCQYRSPLATQGGYVDATPYKFYLRAPFPRDRTSLNGVELSRRPEFASVAFIEVWGEKDLVNRELVTYRVAVVFPPLARGQAPFENATVSAGATEFPQVTMRPGPPGLPTSVSIGGPGATALNRILEQPTVTVKLAGGAGATAEASADFVHLSEDVSRTVTHMDLMHRRDQSGSCAVLTRDWMDGECGR